MNKDQLVGSLRGPQIAKNVLKCTRTVRTLYPIHVVKLFVIVHIT